jgi:glucose-6-phosphate dehydrogenase assembly protein OpcA
VSDRLTRVSSSAAIEEDLSALWRDAARDAPIARALMANLVVYRDCPATDNVDLSAPIEGVPIDGVIERHPSRLIRLHHGGRPDPCAPIGATISIVSFGEAGARFGVEEIAVRSTCADASLPSIVRRLALGDIPTSIWWTEDLSRSTPLEALVAMGRQLLYDSRAWTDLRQGFLTLAPLATRPHGPDLADLNWRRLMPMRQALTHALVAGSAPPNALDPDRPTVGVRHRRDERALAWLLAGWLSARLGWPSAGEMPLTIEEQPDSEGALTVSLGGGAITAVMNGERVLVEYRGGVAPFSIAVPRETEADAVAAELRNLTDDLGLRDALTSLAARLTSSQSPF